MAKLTQSTVGSALRRNHAGIMRPGVIRDTDVAGLSLVVGLRRSRWVFSYRPHGTTDGKRYPSRDLTLGDAMTVSLGEARRLALLAKAAVANGEDPHADMMRQKRTRVAERNAKPTTAQDAWAAYQSAMMTRLHASEVHRRAEVAYVRKALELMAPRALQLEELNAGLVREMLAKLPNRSSETRHLFGALSRYCDWLLANELIPTNPCERISRRDRPKAPPARERAPETGELAQVWRAADQEEMGALA